MFQTYELFFVILGYLFVLFLVAHYAEKREKQNRSITTNPYVYALSLAVYCTSWTFYGSVGKAANSGLDFLTIYLGPTLMVSLWWIILKKIVRISKASRITTISDFIGSRYGNSIMVSAIVTIIAVVGIAPYMGLQIKAIINTFTLLTGNTAGSSFIGSLITFLLGVFAIMFGARRLDASERHSGMVFAIAFESVIKLVAFLMVGVFVTYKLYGGFGDIFSKMRASEFAHLLQIGEDSNVLYPQWFSLTFLSMMAIMFLPRQFHVSVVENSDENHIRKAMWLFPLYLLLINIFVMPVAFGGLLMGISPSLADSYMLILPLSVEQNLLALIAFLGGFSAATAMIIVESLALSTMVMNSLVIPTMYSFSEARGFSAVIINIKRVVIIGVIFVGYMFAVAFGEFYSLVDMGLKSFEAVSLFAPPFLIGLYWKGGNKKGAMAGLIGGFTVWLYTLLIPAMYRAEILHEGTLIRMIFESEMLNPHALFGLKGLDKWSHSLLWSLAVNCALYFGVSIFTRQDEEETKQAISFVEMVPSYSSFMGKVKDIGEIESILCQYIGFAEGKTAIRRILTSRGIDTKGITESDLLVIRDDAERILSGAIGSTIATMILKDRLILTDREREDLSDSIRDMAGNLRLSRQELTEANKQLTFLKEFSENIIESLPLGIVTIDERERVTYWNRYMEKLTGITKGQSYNENVRALIGDMHDCFLDDSIETGEFTCDRARERGANGDSLIKINISPFMDKGKGHVLVLEDITEKHRLEKELSQASKEASLGRLTAGVSHEIGNPLASISSLVQELREIELESGENRTFKLDSLENINSHLERIARIVRSLGDFARISSVDKTPSDLVEILDRMITLIKYDKRAKNIEFISDIKEVPPVLVNPDQIQQVLFNIALNAIDAMPGGGSLNISIDETDGYVEAKFKDTGTGIDKDVIDRIFDPFFTTKPLGKGTGLGLSICYGIIRDHNGDIDVISRPGHGTTFSIKLPKAGVISSVQGKEN
ncbi:MAG: PAS domain-containing protein [Nitrospirota bacterium]|nr:MAG: PAS domain-containing protein [Nitrospirota bacterium]